MSVDPSTYLDFIDIVFEANYVLTIVSEFQNSKRKKK